MNVLVADDSLTARLIVRSTLEPLGHAIIEAEDGQAVLDHLTEADLPDLLVLDWSMPCVDGESVLRALRQRDGRATLPVLVCATGREQDAVRLAMELGAAGVLTKPIQPRVLHSHLERLTRQKPSAN